MRREVWDLSWGDSQSVSCGLIHIKPLIPSQKSHTQNVTQF